ncbi:hypothetical protein [Mycobacterium sp.]|uniref:DUF7065 domain-containing protein n=1 Tax=Mycobacterium sp. TaxID=1785 RepID=UPI0025F01D4A|nr:hypothetical protein [Mycobacterium sp.]
MAWNDKIDEADEQFHQHSDDPYWSENSLLGFTAPERNLCGFIYFYFRPNMNLVVAGPAIWDHTGEDVYNCLYYGWDQHLAIPPNAEMFNFELSNSLSCKMIDPLRKYRFGYDRHGVKIDLTWTALAEPHYMKLADDGKEKQGIGNWVARAGDLSVGHYEQAGTFNGIVEIEGETIAIDCGAVRDRAWGPRYADIKDPLRTGWPYVFASAESGWHLYAPQTALSFDDDPIDGTTETVTHGFYIRDGIKAQIVEGTRRAQRGRDGRVLTQVIHCVDELGRELHAEGQNRNWLKWPHYSDILNWWSLVRWEYDGQVVYGEDQDVMNFRYYRKLWTKLLAEDRGLLHCFPDSSAYPPYGVSRR